MIINEVRLKMFCLSKDIPQWVRYGFNRCALKLYKNSTKKSRKSDNYLSYQLSDTISELRRAFLNFLMDLVF